MKLNSRYDLREIAGKGVLMPARVFDPSVRTPDGGFRTLSLSSSAYWLLRYFYRKEFTVGQAVDAICEHFDVDRVTAEADIVSILDILRSNSALDD